MAGPEGATGTVYWRVNVTAGDDDMAVRIAILEDHQLLSASLKAALEADGYSVVAPALTNLSDVAESLTGASPDVAILDLDLGCFGSGESLLPVLTDCGTRVIVVSGSTDDAVAGGCLKSGARGWVPKSAPLDELLVAISKEASGVNSLDPRDRQRLISAWRKRQSAVAARLAPFHRLTSREAAVLELLRAGKSVEQIAGESYVSVATVRTQVRAILMKLEVRSQLEAVAKANRADWASESD